MSSTRQTMIISGSELKQKSKKKVAPTATVDLSNVEDQWKEVLRFMDHWQIQPLKTKNAYTKSEVMEYLKVVFHKFTELDSVTTFERTKAEEYKEEAALLNQ